MNIQLQGDFDVLMSKQLGQCFGVISVFNTSCGKRMSKGVKTHTSHTVVFQIPLELRPEGSRFLRYGFTSGQDKCIG